MEDVNRKTEDDLRTTSQINNSRDESLLSKLEKTTFRAVPHNASGGQAGDRPTWRLLFEVLSSSPPVSFGLDINDDVVMGRGKGGPEFIDLSMYDAEALGVSRRHLIIRPKQTKLFVFDLGSTNGTRHNDRPIGVNTPYILSTGDILSLGNLQLSITVVQPPEREAVNDYEEVDLATALAGLAKAITSELKLDEVLNQIVKTAMSLTSAGETAVWLVDDKTGELILEAEKGIEDENIKRIRLPVEDTLAGQALQSGEPLRASRSSTKERLKIKTGYMVDAVVYVPLVTGDVPIGVLAAAHRDTGMEFSPQDEQILASIADFAAIAVQNSRIYEATDEALTMRVSELASLNELMRVVSSSLDLGRIQSALMKQLQRQWKFDAAGIWLVDERTNTLVPFPEPMEPGDDLVRHTYKMGEGVVGEVAQSGDPKLAQNVQSSGDLGAKADQESTIAFRARSAACVPLKSESQVIGVLALFNNEKAEFSLEDLSRLQAFGNAITTAIQNSQLFAQVQRERATVLATANMLSQPLMIVDDRGDLVLSNPAADAMWASLHGQQSEEPSTEAEAPVGSLSQLIEGLRLSVGRATEIALGSKNYVATTVHAPDIGTIVAMQDVTHVRQLEQLRSEFAQTISHDIRGPLGSIMGFANLLMTAQLSPRESREFLDEILGASDRILTLANQLIDFSMLGTVPKTSHTPSDLTRVVSEAVSDLRGKALAKSIGVLHETEGKPYQIQGDTTRLYRCVLNLVDNAINYSPNNSRVQVQLTFDETAATLRVRDSGPGIPPDDLPHIFEKYYRGKHSSGEPIGIGLGLAMVKATVSAHGGQVSAHNLEEGGAEFVIDLPASLRV